MIASCSDDKPQLNPLSQTSIILAFGDSLTFGTGTSKDKSYPSILNNLTGINVINEGIPGEVSAKGEARLDRLLDKHKPDLVILCHGGNDLLQKINTQLTINNLKAMITTIRENRSDVVLLSVPKPGILLKPAPFYAEIAEEMGVPIGTGILSKILSSSDLKSDTAHPNEKGYRQMAEDIAELLLDRKAINQLN